MQNFDIRVQGNATTGYQVEVTGSPAGETPQAAPMPSLLDDPAVQEVLTDLTDFVAQPEVVRRLGHVLWRALFQPPVATRYAESRGIAGAEGLRIRLRLDPVELMSLPWEYLYDPETDRFAALSRHASLVRYVPRPEPVTPLAVKGPLRILVLISAPTDQPALAVDQERALLEEALAPLVRAGQVALAFETDARPATLQDRLREGFHVLHYVGHALLARGQGHLVLVDEEGRSRFVSAAALEALLGTTNLRLVVLNACESAVAPGDPFLGLGAALVRGGLPAVVAMQMAMPDESAVIFAREFYRSLADRLPVDTCVTEGRLGIRVALRDTRIDWGIPVLFLRTDEGVIFQKPPQEEQPSVTEAEETPAGREGGVTFGPGSRVTVGGDIVGRDKIVTGGKAGELADLFTRLEALIAAQAGLDDATRQQALQEARALKAELTSDKPDASRVEELKQALLSKGQWIASAIAAIFGTADD